MLFWLILHRLQLSGAEAADAGFNGKKWTLREPGPLGPLPAPPFGLYIAHIPKTLKQGEFPEFRRRSVEETYREEKTSPKGRFRRGEHLLEGEIIAIVITIVTGIIDIIINIIPNISTIST